MRFFGALAGVVVWALFGRWWGGGRGERCSEGLQSVVERSSRGSYEFISSLGVKAFKA